AQSVTPYRYDTNTCTPPSGGSRCRATGDPTLRPMPIRVKQVRVAFYALEPAPPFGEQKSFPLGAYPLAEIVACVGEMDRASEDYRLPETMWGGETLCVFHEDGPQPLLGAYYRDNWAKALTEFKGEIEELPLRDGEALVDTSFAAFFPGDVVGIVR